MAFKVKRTLCIVSATLLWGTSFAVYMPVHLAKPVAENNANATGAKEADVSYSNAPIKAGESPNIVEIGTPDTRKGKIVANTNVLEKARVKLINGELPEVPKDGIPRIDATNNDSVQQSFFNALMSLDGEGQEKFSTAWVTLSVTVADPTIGNAKVFREVVHGKSADEIIALTRRLSPITSDAKLIVDGSSPEKFGKSIGQILVALSAEKRSDFSEAIAKVIYDLGDTKKDEVFKMLDGKTPEEVIEMATKIKIPFDMMKEKNLRDKEIVLEPSEVAPEWAREKEQSTGKSLVPSAIIPKSNQK